MTNINEWRVWRLFIDDPNDWTPWDRFQIWFDFWWNEWCCVITTGVYYLLAGLLLSCFCQLL